ncbi:SDR family oxidoreductase [Acidipila sp. EB88]|uniref:SDR family oxidoreductase n=1 Tax=Acidipila sp. EB88 TaxID=2305226 RepID=UPI000F5DCF3B|nr:SDR family oxidoreductase [Acidipila sp. EB88]RRA50253.1 SDR family oxidoreductase [Acidipila sp. EB88]
MSSDNNTFSRRELVANLGAGIAGAALTAAVPAVAEQTVAGTQSATTAAPFVDPTTKYPKPPYPGQTQPWPGLASKMNPRPDHGESSYKGSGRLLGRKALITGGDSGMGRAAAIAYAREGADVVISYYPTEESDAVEVIELIRAAGRKAIPLPGDLREESYCKDLVTKAVAGLGGLDIIVSNAGRQQECEDLLQLTTEAFDATLKTNLYAPFWIFKAALPHLQPGSCIIATASEQAYDPGANVYDYAQTKAATVNFVKSLAKQLGPKGIRVNGVAPGPIWTPLQVSGGATQEHLIHYGQKYPLGRAGQPAELASIYVQLAANDASYTTGNIYGAGGGMGQP